MGRKKAAFGGALAGLAAARLVDVALIGGSLSLAVGAVGFATYMTLAQSHAPLVNGMQYLEIFAQPNRHAAREEVADSQPVDLSPVGALPPPQAYGLVGADETSAWLREGNRIFAAHPGDDVPRLGRIASIERRDGRWALIGGDGRTLLVSAVAEIAPSPRERFHRRMIFGDGK